MTFVPDLPPGSKDEISRGTGRALCEDALQGPSWGPGDAAPRGPAGFGVSRLSSTGTATAPSGGNGSVWVGTVGLQLHPTEQAEMPRPAPARRGAPSPLPPHNHRLLEAPDPLMQQGWPREAYLLIKDMCKRGAEHRGSAEDEASALQLCSYTTKGERKRTCWRAVPLLLRTPGLKGCIQGCLKNKASTQPAEPRQRARSAR